MMNEFTITLNNRKHSVKIFDPFKVEINGKIMQVELSVLNNNSCLLKYGNKLYEITMDRIGNKRFGLLINGWYFDITVRTKLEETVNDLMKKKDFSKKLIEIHAPMPGLILKILKSVGEEVKKGEPMLIFEAMKMENELRSSVDGTIKNILIKEGDTVEKNILLVIIE